MCLGIAMECTVDHEHAESANIAPSILTARRSSAAMLAIFAARANVAVVSCPVWALIFPLPETKLRV